MLRSEVSCTSFHFLLFNTSAHAHAHPQEHAHAHNPCSQMLISIVYHNEHYRSVRESMATGKSTRGVARVSGSSVSRVWRTVQDSPSTNEGALWLYVYMYVRAFVIVSIHVLVASEWVFFISFVHYDCHWVIMVSCFTSEKAKLYLVKQLLEKADDLTKPYLTATTTGYLTGRLEKMMHKYWNAKLLRTVFLLIKNSFTSWGCSKSWAQWGCIWRWSSVAFGYCSLQIRPLLLQFKYK